MDSPGRSGAKFYLSHDQLYVVKTLTSEEVEQMHFLLKQYHPFVVERHGKQAGKKATIILDNFNNSL